MLEVWFCWIALLIKALAVFLEIREGEADRASRKPKYAFFTLWGDYLKKTHTEHCLSKWHHVWVNPPQNPSANTHSIKPDLLIISPICGLASGKLKYACCAETSERHIYLFLLSAQGHCFHGDRLMASFPSLFLIYFPTSLPSYLQYLCLKTPHDRCGSASPPCLVPNQYSTLFIPAFHFLEPSSLKD